MSVAKRSQIFLVALVVFSTFSARLAFDSQCMVAVTAETSEERAESESDSDSFDELLGALVIPVEGVRLVSVASLLSDATFHLPHVFADDVSARGPPRA